MPEGDLALYSLPVQRHRQEAFNFCAAAALAAVLEGSGIIKTQAQIWSDTRPLLVEPKIYYTDPDAIATYLNETLSQSTGVTYRASGSPSFEWVVSKLVRDVAHYKFPPLLLVFAGKHWIVVRGMTARFADALQESGLVATLQIVDSSRGSDGIETRPINASMREWLQPVKLAGKWNGLYVCISDASDDVIDNLEFVSPARISFLRRVLAAADDVEGTVIADMSIYGIGSATRLLGGGAEYSTVRVYHIGRSETYYLVPLELNGRMVWAIKNEKYGELESVLDIDESLIPPDGLELQSAIERYVGSPVAFQVREGLYWKDSVELPSKFDVVRIVQIDAREYFVKRDGSVVIELHEVGEHGLLSG